MAQLNICAKNSSTGVKSVVMTCIAQALDIHPHRSQHPGAADALPLAYLIIMVFLLFAIGKHNMDSSCNSASAWYLRSPCVGYQAGGYAAQVVIL